MDHARSQRDTPFVQEEELLARVRLLSSEANHEAVNKAEQALARESAEAARKTTAIQEAVDKQHKARWKEAEAQIRVGQESNSAQVQQDSLRRNDFEHQDLHTADEIQLEAQGLCMSQDMEQPALSVAHQREQEWSALKTILSAKAFTMDKCRPVVETEPDILLNTKGPCSSWILPSQTVTPLRPTTGGE